MSAPAPRGPARSGADPAVITDWNATAVATIVTDAGKANAEAFLWYAFEQAAVYNAVVGITATIRLYKWNTRGPKWASPEAAAAAAAHRVLLTYFPASQARLDCAHDRLARPDPGRSRAKEQGIRYGEQAADRIIELASTTAGSPTSHSTCRSAPGVWRPTPAGVRAVLRPVAVTVRPCCSGRRASSVRPVRPL